MIIGVFCSRFAYLSWRTQTLLFLLAGDSWRSCAVKWFQPCQYEPLARGMETSPVNQEQKTEYEVMAWTGDYSG